MKIQDTEDTISPRIDDDGIPRCTEDDCPQYDGKRCMALGFRPQSICEPAVILMAKAIKEADAMVKRHWYPGSHCSSHYTEYEAARALLAESKDGEGGR